MDRVRDHRQPRPRCYHQCSWFRIGEGFVEHIREQVADVLSSRSDLALPLWTPTGRHDDEHRYCQQVAATQAGYVCLDSNLASTPFHPRFELCDCLGPRGELIFIKWLGRATALSHLCTQAAVSADALREEPEAMIQLAGKVKAIDPQRTISEPSCVVLAAAGREWTVDQIFTLSQIGLLRLHRTLRRLQIRLAFANIPYVPKKR